MSTPQLLKRIQVLESRRDAERLARLAALEPRDTAAAQAADRMQTRMEGSFLSLVRREVEGFHVGDVKVLNVRGRRAPARQQTDNIAWARFSSPIGEVTIEYDASHRIVRLERFGASRRYSFTKTQISAAGWSPIYLFHGEDEFSSVETRISGIDTKREAARKAVAAIKRLAEVVASRGNAT